MTSKEFWSHVENQKNELISLRQKQIRAFFESGNPAALEGQPEDSMVVFIISKKNLDRGTFPGRVNVVNLRLAAQRLVEDTHRVATPAEIEQHLREQDESLAQVQRLEAQFANRRNVFVSSVPRDAR